MGVFSLHEVHKYYGAKHVLQGVNLEVYEGEKVGLLGKNGAGKTTLLKILAGTERCDDGSVSRSTAARVGVLDQIPEYPRHYTVMDVLQTALEHQYQLEAEMKTLEVAMATDPDADLIRRYGEIQTRFAALGGYTLDSTIARVCTGLRIDSRQQGQAYQLLSGGEKTRINLGRIMLQDTNTLLLDEPTNHLDIQSVEWLEEYLSQYKGTLVVISHDRYFLDRVVTRIIDIENGKAELYAGSYSYYIREKEARFQQKLEQHAVEQRKIKQLTEAANRLHEWARNGDNPSLHKRAFAMEKRIERLDQTEKPVKDRALTVGFLAGGAGGKDIIELAGVAKAFGENPVLTDISLTVYRGDRTALLGSNGGGKTTLLRLITGEELPDAGSVRLGSSVRYAFLPQNVVFGDTGQSVLDTVRYELNVGEVAARHRLAAFHFQGDDVFKPVGSLSGGEKSRLKLCLLMQQNINLLILDEPTNHLDVASREWIEAAVADFSGTVLFVSHDRYFINRFATKIWDLAAGRVTAFSGTYGEYRAWVSRIVTTPPREPLPSPKKATTAQSKKPAANPSAITVQTIEERILSLESRGKEIEREMEAAGSDFARLQSLFEEKILLAAEIEAQYVQWEALQLADN